LEPKPTLMRSVSFMQDTMAAKKLDLRGGRSLWDAWINHPTAGNGLNENLHGRILISGSGITSSPSVPWRRSSSLMLRYRSRLSVAFPPQTLAIAPDWRRLLSFCFKREKSLDRISASIGNG
jgi:hypothetical protein